MGKDRYAPGELSKVRERLGPVDWEEAKNIAEKLGGEVGYERSHDEEKSREEAKKTDTKLPGRPNRRVELRPDSDREESHRKKHQKYRELSPLDNPAIQLKASFFDRLKMDRFAAQPDFEIKTTSQIVHLMVRFFSEPPDYVSGIFINRRMPEYYKKMESMVLATRTMFPRNNVRRNEKIKKAAPLAYAILDVIRYWNIEKISGDLAKIQARPKNALVSDFSEILKAIYRPLFLLENLDPDTHIRGAFKVLYKVLYLENPGEAKNRGMEMIRTALASFFEIKQNIRYLLYPLLMKSVSSKYVHYNNFFRERKHRIMAFINATEDEQLSPGILVLHGDLSDNAQEQTDPEKPEETVEAVQENEEAITEEDKSRRNAQEAEKKALEKGLNTLEALFPKAGWDKLSEYPDLYPYFMDTLDLKRGVVNIAPTDPMQQITVLMRILEELFFGLRSVSFGNVSSITGNMESVEETLGGVINGWRNSIESIIGNEYLPRMTDYIRILEGSAEERISPYTRKLVSELHWIKRLYFLPMYKFDTTGTPSLNRKGIEPIYTKIKIMRKYFSAIASGIEQGIKAGGAEARAACDGIDNPWDPYLFQVPNPLSVRLNALVAQKSRNNATLIYFCLAVGTVLDYLVNNENSWAYDAPSTPLFRSVNGDGITPLTGVDSDLRIDAEALFKQSLKQRQKKP